MGILVVAAIAVAALGVYLLIIGAVALVGWLAAVAARRQPATQAPHLVPAATPSAAPAPNQQYHVVLSVNATTFDDPAAIERAACGVFAAWARQLPSAPSDPSDAIRGLALRTRLIGRLTTKLDGRRFVWRSGPFRGRDRNTSATAIDPSNLDPYNPPSDLRSRSGYVSLCRSCGGDGRIECTSCGGAARVTCIACNGAGKVDGVTKSGARRLLNCKTCKGKASLACGSCSRGKVDCGACQQSGRVEHWLEVEGGPRNGDVQVEPDGDVTRAFVWGKDGVVATHDEIVRDARIVCSVTHDRQLRPDDLPPEVPSEWRDSYWQPIQARLQPGERVVSQTFTLLEVPSVEVTYAVGRETQAIELEGLRLLAPPVSADQLFRARASGLRRLAYALGAVPLIVGIAYAIRGSYYFAPPVAGVVFCSALAAALVYGVIWHASLRGSARRWLASAIVPIGAAIALAIVAEPSEAAARRYIEAGRLDLARTELDALGDARDDDLAPLWADVHLKEALAAKTCSDATQHLTKIASNTPQHAKARAHADALAMGAAETALASNQLVAARSALRCASDDGRANPGRILGARIEIAAARSCLDAKDWPCVISRAKEATDLGAGPDADTVRAQAFTAIRTEVDEAIARAKTEKDLAARVRLRRSAIDQWGRYLVAESEPAELVALKKDATKDEQALAVQEEAARKRREAEEKRLAAEQQRKREAEERAEKRRIAEEERRERASMPRSIRCCDGTLSPSCMCGGSRRGCCSHHGGVCGCE
jgi:hypothetical protein